MHTPAPLCCTSLPYLVPAQQLTPAHDSNIFNCCTALLQAHGTAQHSVELRPAGAQCMKLCKACPPHGARMAPAALQHMLLCQPKGAEIAVGASDTGHSIKQLTAFNAGSTYGRTVGALFGLSGIEAHLQWCGAALHCSLWRSCAACGEHLACCHLLRLKLTLMN